MDLLTDNILKQLIANGQDRLNRIILGEDDIDYMPVVKLFTPDANATWLLSEVEPDNPDIAFGLCDLGLGCPELGSVSISDIKAIRGRYRLPVERDLHFTPRATLSEYAARARERGGISA